MLVRVSATKDETLSIKIASDESVPQAYRIYSSVSRNNTLAWQMGSRLQAGFEGMETKKKKEGERERRRLSQLTFRQANQISNLCFKTKLFIGPFRLVLRYIKNPWFVILCHSESERDCEAGKVSHVVFHRKLIIDFSSGNF
jgi:hypothetical protein